jgi:hypothetical protein
VPIRHARRCLAQGQVSFVTRGFYA